MGGTASATSYTCVEGSFPVSLNTNYCGGYQLGGNGVDESATVWSGTTVSQTLGGDDVSTSGPRVISLFNFSLLELTGSGVAAGDAIMIGNGNQPDGIGEFRALTFQVVPIPAAVWLFGSALGLLGWM